MLLNTCVLLLLVTLFLTEPSHGFVRYTLLNNVTEVQWKSNQLCLDMGTDGLAIVNTPEKWESVVALLDYSNHPQSQDVWIGLEYIVHEGEARWRGGQTVYSWGAWDANEPLWSRTNVVITRNSTGYAWKTEGSNYENAVLCDTTFNGVQMSKHLNDYEDLSSATALLTKQATSSEDCAMLCAFTQSCSYLTYDDSGKTCAMYDDTLASLLGSSQASPNPFSLYRVSVS